MAYALSHKDKATAPDNVYNPLDGPEAYSNPSVHSRLSDYSEMAREVHGPEFDPITEPIDGEVLMRSGGGKKHGRYSVANSLVDTASTPTLSSLKARATDSTPPIRPRQSTTQIQMDQFKVNSVLPVAN